MMRCPVCANQHIQPLVLIRGGAAMQNFLAPTLHDALRAQDTTIHLHGCPRCSFVWNATFDPKKIRYARGYCNAPYYSDIFRRYLERLAHRLVENHHLASRRVVEIGCGQGMFLSMLRKNGAKRLLGFDPAYVRTGTPMDQVVRRETFPPRRLPRADFVMCMEVLEHIPDVRRFLKDVQAMLSPTGSLYFEMPSLKWIVARKAIFDFTYEHCNYFSPLALAWALGAMSLGRFRFTTALDGQYLGVKAERGRLERMPEPSFALEDIPRFVHGELARYRQRMSRWGRFAVWGVAGKGVTFLTRLKVPRSSSPCAIDINPAKQGRFVPITGQSVAGPDILQQARIHTILVMNPIYEKEIKRMAKKNGYRGRFVVPYGSSQGL